MHTWQLPEGIDELVGDEAMRFEMLRRQLLDLYHSKGFELVIPPLVEYIESLLLTSESVDLKTVKFVDVASGKMLGVHADITPQIARIDSKRAAQTIEKYCYINTTLQTKADDFYATRSPIQAGAELYGVRELWADVEIIELMLESLALLSINPIVLSLGNVAIFDALVAKYAFTHAQITQLRRIFQQRSAGDLQYFFTQNQLDGNDLFAALLKLEGDECILEEALTLFKDAPQTHSAIQDLADIGGQLRAKGVRVIYDLAELKSYEYHTGIVFSAYNVDYSKALAQGGRYNGLGASFHQNQDSRAATGFSFDLKFLSQTAHKIRN